MRWPLILALLLLSVPAFALIEIYSPRYEESGRVLVQMRPIFEALGADVEWVAAERQITATRGSLWVRMWINNNNANLNHGHVVILDVPPRLVGGSTRVPLRFVGETFGATVDYLGDRVRIQEPARETIMVYLEGSGGGVPPSPGPGGGEGRWPFTSTRTVHNSDLTGRDNWPLTLMRNEIYARHGRSFANDYLRNYFEAQPWYSVCATYSDRDLSTLEHHNAAFILDYQNRTYGSPAEHPPF
jgi:hypothetical protein